MPPSTGSGVAAPDQHPRGPRPHCAPTDTRETSPTFGRGDRVITLPPATRRAQMDRWGVAREFTGSGTLRFNGRVAYPGVPLARRVRRATAVAEGAIGFLRSGAWYEVAPLAGKARGAGMTSHRGVLHPDEYVDRDALRDRVASHLGFTVEEIRSVYRQGRMSDEGRALRARIDARLLEVAEAGGLMLELARALGWAIRTGARGDKCATLENAMARAREARLGAAA